MAKTEVARKPNLFRRKYLVNRRYQGGFIAFLCALTAFVAVVAGWRVYVGVHGALTDTMYRSHLPTGEVWEIIRPPLIWTNLSFAAGSFLLAVVTVAVILRKSSQLLRRIEQEIQAIDGTGAPPEAETKLLWNDAAKSAAAGLRHLMQPFTEVADQLDEIAARVDTSPGENSQALARELGDIIEHLEEGRRGFQC